MWKSNCLYQASGSADMTLGILKPSCLCGQVRIETPKRPDFINECNCTLCSKSGARWAYFHPSEVIVVGTTKGYSRKDKEGPAAEIHFCANCGMHSAPSVRCRAIPVGISAPGRSIQPCHR